MLAKNPNDGFQADSEAFIDWLVRQHGTQISSKIALVDLREKDQGRGVVATGNIEAGEELFTLSYGTTLTVGGSAFHGKAASALKSLPYWAALVLVLIYEHGQESHSRWKPYLRLLPHSLNTLMYWSESELSELRGSNVLRKIGKKDADDLFGSKLWPIARAYRSDFGIYGEMLGDTAKAAFLSLCHRMASIIFAYGFDHDPDFASDVEQETSDDGEECTKIMLVPLADMLNANADMNNAHLVQNQTTVTMTAIKAVRSGDQIFNDFGELPRSDLLRRYGYVTDEYQKYDVVELSLVGIRQALTEAANLESMDLPEIQERLLTAESHGILEDGYDLAFPQQLSDRATIPMALIQLLLLLQDDTKTFERFMKSEEDEIDLRSIFESTTLLPIFENILHRRLAEYPTTIAQDRVMLAEVDVTGRKRMAIEVRLGEKEILAGWLEATNFITKDRTRQILEPAKPAKRKKI